MRTLGPLGHASRALFDELVQSEKLRCFFCRAGYYEIYLTERGLESAKEDMRIIVPQGFHPEVLSGAELREREPAINDLVVGGIFYPEAATINPYQFVMEMAERAERHGAKFQTSSGVASLRSVDGRIRGVQLQNGESIEADSVVLAAGAYSVPLLRQLGIRFPLQAAKGGERRKETKAGVLPLVVDGQERWRSGIQIEHAPAARHIRIAEQLLEETFHLVVRRVGSDLAMHALNDACSHTLPVFNERT